MQICLKSASWFMRYCAQKTKSALQHIPMLYPSNLPTSSWDTVHTSTFWLKFGSLSSAMTLKIRLRSPKPNQLFIMSQCYMHADLGKIHPPGHAIQYIQESVTLTLTPTPTAPIPICPLRKKGKHIVCMQSEWLSLSQLKWPHAG